MINLPTSMTSAALTASRATNRILNGMRDGVPYRETAFCSILEDNLCELFGDNYINGLSWTFSSESSLKQDDEESSVPPIFLMAVEVRLRDISQPIPSLDPIERLISGSTTFWSRGGIIASPLNVDEDDMPSHDEWNLIQQTCLRMLDISRSAYVVAYSARRIRFIPATAIIGCTFTHPFNMFPQSCRKFYSTMFSFVLGDPALASSSIPGVEFNPGTLGNPAVLRWMMEKHSIDCAMILRGATYEEDPDENYDMDED